ncbi:MAG: polysaccharide deacetylase family protein [Gemmatimonadales bacterium]|nr:polysaccharide deacetylase family protein [Gemmatimonadales bacterium]
MRCILTYHSIDSSGSPISIDSMSFRRHVDWLAEGPVQVVTLEALLTLPPDTEAVAITFDDGFTNFVSEAAPVLQDRRLPATLFVVSGHVGGTNAWGGRADPGIPTLPLLDWDALGRLAEQGVDLGAHTHTHTRLPHLPPGELRSELEGSLETIQTNTGYTPTTFAYPYGAVDDRSARATGRLFKLACTTDHRPLGAGEDVTRLPRVDMYYYRDEPGLCGWGTPRFRRRLWTRRTARRLKETLVPKGMTR